MSEAERVLREIEEMARKGLLPHPIIGPRRGSILVRLIREHRPKRVLEIGTLVGYSTILMGKELDSDAYLITIEKDAESARKAIENIRRANIPPRVEVLVGDALEIIPRLEGMFDFVFIDAEKSEYLDYLLLIENKLRKGAVIVADNARHAPEFLDYVRYSGKYSCRHVPAEAGGIEICIKL